MKRNFLLGLVAILSIVLVSTGCSKTSESTTETQNESKELMIYVIRHGKTMLNTTHRVQGWSDAVLTPEGEEVVGHAGIGMKDIEFQNVYSSDSGRAIQTAQIVLDENKKTNGITVHPDKRFREFNFGSYEGDLNENMWKDVAERMNIPFEEYLDVITPQLVSNHVYELDKERTKDEDTSNWSAENFDEISKRLKDGLDEIAKKESNKNGSGNILIASHGLSIEALMTTLFGEDYEKPEGGFKNASVSIIKYKNGKYTLEKVGSLEYIENGAKEAK